MKKYGLLMMLLAVCMVFTSCSLKTNEDEADKLVEAAKQIEIYENKLYNFKTTYDDYKKNTQALMIADYNKDDETIFADNGKVYKGKDLKGMPLNKLKELGNKLYLEMYGTTELKRDTTYVSGVYYNKDDSSQFKYVFAKEIRKIKDEEMIIYKKYMFLKENNAWKVFSISKASEIKNLRELPEKEVSAYTMYDNKPVKYIATIDLLKVK
jgi:hypothetical protein